jgi:hypothetical protein
MASATHDHVVKRYTSDLTVPKGFIVDINLKVPFSRSMVLVSDLQQMAGLTLNGACMLDFELLAEPPPEITLQEAAKYPRLGADHHPDSLSDSPIVTSRWR